MLAEHLYKITNEAVPLWAARGGTRAQVAYSQLPLSISQC